MEPMSRAERDKREKDIQYLEEVSLNAWPSYMIELYDGWLIRFSYNYSYRTNSVEQVGISTIPVEEKIAYCEAVYDPSTAPAPSRFSLSWIPHLITGSPSAAMKSGTLRK